MQILLFLYLYTLLSVHLFAFAMPRASTVKKDEAGMRFTTFSMPPSSVGFTRFPEWLLTLSKGKPKACQFYIS